MIFKTYLLELSQLVWLKQILFVNNEEVQASALKMMRDWSPLWSDICQCEGKFHHILNGLILLKIVLTLDQQLVWTLDSGVSSSWQNWQVVSFIYWLILFWSVFFFLVSSHINTWIFKGVLIDHQVKACNSLTPLKLRNW